MMSKDLTGYGESPLNNPEVFKAVLMDKQMREFNQIMGDRKRELQNVFGIPACMFVNSEEVVAKHG